MVFTSSEPLGEAFTKQWLGASHTQKHSWDHVVADDQRVWLGASLPQKMFTGSYSSSISGIMENFNKHLAPGFMLKDLVPAPANVVILWGLLLPLHVCVCGGGAGGAHTLY